MFDLPHLVLPMFTRKRLLILGFVTVVQGYVEKDGLLLYEAPPTTSLSDGYEYIIKVCDQDSIVLNLLCFSEELWHVFHQPFA